MVNIKGWSIYKILREIKWWSILVFLKPYINFTRRIAEVTKEHHFEKRLGIETAGNLPIKQGFTAREDNFSYQPTPYTIADRMLNHLELGPEDVFLDLGCGKGRAVFSVATKKIKKVIGVEAQEETAKIAMQNLKNLKLKNTPVEIVNMDVINFDMREGTIFYMYNPFEKETVTKVISNIKDSLIINLRKIRIVCYGIPYLYKLGWLTYESTIRNSKITVWCAKA